MAATESRKRKSLHFDHDEQTTTPTGSPVRKKLKLTRSQKQALINNLQLEITERARKLRMQYALQVQDLRARIERRINRVPMALRKMTMGELLEKHMAASTQPAGTRKPTSPTKTGKQTVIPRDPVPSIVAKAPSYRIRTSEGIYSDKENAPVAVDAPIPLENPKRRGNPVAPTGPASAGPSRAVSQVMRDAEAKVLSPKSNNSRTYKQSPLLTASPTKTPRQHPPLTRPVSPLKPSSPLKAMIDSARARTAGKDTSSAAGVTSSPISPRKTRPTPQSQTKNQTKKPASRTAAATRQPAKSPAVPRHERATSTSTTSSTNTTATTIVKSSSSRAAASTATTAAATSKRSAAPGSASRVGAKKTTATTTTSSNSRSQAPTPAASAKRAAATATSRKQQTVDSSTSASSTGRTLRRRV
ncbi:hypothetical protein VTN31DRAFT_4296 [Thermomyces dupontii]|uniref:uncharacterized protein n=1 Tax=Talaromyces thermophilus TaxID=28565 RepID=UPI003742A321